MINTPNRFHFGQAKIALEADKHVYVERPIVCPDDDLELLIRLAKQEKRLLFTGVQRRLEDTYRYLYEVVKNHYYFNRLSSIRCFLAAGMQLQDWRRSLNLAGGGIVIDQGYHLLDAAAWICSAAKVEISDHISGAVLFKREMKSSESYPPEVETTAVGHINLPKGVLLNFDLSYHAPIDSIYEHLEIRDDKGAKVTLTRDQSKRSTIPATITHQRSDGSLVEVKAFSNLKVKMDKIRFSGTANNTGPLRSFLQTIQGEFDLKKPSSCDAQLSLNTWRLVRGIYRLAREEGT